MKPRPEDFISEYQDQVALAAHHARLEKLHELKAGAALLNSFYFDAAVNTPPNRTRRVCNAEFDARLRRIWKSA